MRLRLATRTGAGTIGAKRLHAVVRAHCQAAIATYLPGTAGEGEPSIPFRNRAGGRVPPLLLAQ